MNYEIVLRKMRQRIFDYPEEKQAKASRVLLAVKEKFMKQDFPRQEKVRLQREAAYMRRME